MATLCSHDSVDSDSSDTTQTTNTPRQDHYRLTLGVGGNSSLVDDETFTPGIIASYQYAHSVYSAGLIFNGGYSNSEFPRGQGIPEIDLLYGLATQWSVLYGSVSAGVSYNQYDIRGKYLRDSTYAVPYGKQQVNITQPLFEEKISSGVGLPIQIQVMVTPLPVLGFGLVVFANVNSTFSYWGVLACLQVGWF